MMKITVLAENTACRDDLAAEHGLSLFCETADAVFLFDMGQTDLFARNADVLGIDLARAEFAVLSHGHYDHGGGMAEFFRRNNRAPVYLTDRAFEGHYNGAEKYIGLDLSLRENPRLIFTGDSHVIRPGFTLSTMNDMPRPDSFGSFGLTKMSGSALVPDDFLHEQYLLVEEAGKRILLSGCSHKGILDIMRWYHPDVLIGGFHFSKLEDEGILAEAACRLNEFDTDYYTCHCTGASQAAFLGKRMPRLHTVSCGDTITI